jgi:hypothetical protein
MRQWEGYGGLGDEGAVDAYSTAARTGGCSGCCEAQYALQGGIWWPHSAPEGMPTLAGIGIRVRCCVKGYPDALMV